MPRLAPVPQDLRPWRAVRRSATAPPGLCPGALLRGGVGVVLDAANADGAVVLGHRNALVEAAATAAPARDVARLHAAAAAAVARGACGAEAVALGADGEGALRAALQGARLATGRPEVADLAATPVDALSEHMRAGAVAAVLADASALGEAASQRLHAARLLCDRHGAALVLDERRTSPRWADGGAQATFKLRADLAVYGRGLANGRGFGALAGRRELVAAARLVAPDVFAPTPQALAAVAATALVLEHAPVRAVLQVRGSEVQAELEAALAATGAAAVCRVAGDPTAVRLVFEHARLEPRVLRRLLRAELRSRGVLLRGAVCVSYAWGDAEVSAFVDAATAAFAVLARSLQVEARLAAA